MIVVVLLAGVATTRQADAQVFNWFDPVIDYSQHDGSSTWVDVDVSADVPAGATGVMVEVKTEGSSDDQFAIRKKLAAGGDEWMWGPTTIKNDTHTWFIVGVDSNRVFEVKEGDNDIDIYLLGYTTDGVTLFDNAVDMGVGAGTWEDVDVGAHAGSDTAIGGIFVIQNTGGSQGWSIRMNGASDNRGSHCPGGSAGGDLRTDMSTLAIVGLDGGELCEACIESTGVKVYLVGYVTAGAVFFQEPIQGTVAISYTDNDITPHIGTDDANGALVQIWTDFDDRHQTGIRMNGAGHDFDKWTSNQFAPVAVDADDIFEFETDDTDGIEIWLYGYTLATLPPPPAISSAADQSFFVGDGLTANSPITITESAAPAITAGNDLRVRIPAGFNMLWDKTDLDATIGGTASGKVSSTVSYEDAGATLVLDVTSNFAAGETVTVSDLSFMEFTAPSSLDNLELEVENDGAVTSTDDKTIAIGAPNYRSIGSGGELYSAGTASINSGTSVVTFASATLPTDVGLGDKLTIGSPTSYSDDFEDGVITGWTNVWTHSLSESSGKLRQTSAPDDSHYIVDEGSAWTDYTVTCDIMAKDNDDQGISFRVQDGSNFYVLRQRFGNAGPDRW
ncbi:MAG: hypothetical protein ACYS1E_20315, partial [Planctomycetota bacterium]